MSTNSSFILNSLPKNCPLTILPNSIRAAEILVIFGKLDTTIPGVSRIALYSGNILAISFGQFRRRKAPKLRETQKYVTAIFRGYTKYYETLNFSDVSLGIKTLTKY